jgi:hypothetical protein
MGTSDPIASTTSLLSTNTTSSSFDPQKKDRTKQSPPQKDYAAAFSALQCKYGLPDATMTTSTPLPLPSRKLATPQFLPTPANPAGFTRSSAARVSPLPTKKQRGEKAKTPSPLALLRARFRSSNPPLLPSPRCSSPSEGEGLTGNADEIGKADAAITPQPIG